MDTGDANWLNGSRITTGSGGFSVSSISVYVEDLDTATANRLYQVAIYADANGRPGARLANSATGTLSARAWNTLSISATLSPNASYWLIYNTNGRSTLVNNMRMDAASAAVGAWSAVGVPFGTWPATFGSATLAPQNWSIYASGT